MITVRGGIDDQARELDLPYDFLSLDDQRKGAAIIEAWWLKELHPYQGRWTAQLHEFSYADGVFTCYTIQNERIWADFSTMEGPW